MTQNTFLAEALAAEKQGRFPDALNSIRKGLRQSPGSADLLLTMGRILERLKKWTEAQAIYSKMVEPGGKMSKPVALGLSGCLIATSKFEQARKILSALHQQEPNNIQVLVGLAECARNRNDLADAGKLLDKAESLDKDHKIVRHERARLQIANKADDEAIRTLEKNIDRKDPHGDSIDLWIETVRKQKRDLYLREKLRELAKRNPERPEFIFGLGLTYSRAGEVDNARRELERVNKMLPKNYRILYELGVLERLAGNIEKSQAYFADVLDIKPDHAAAIRTYGVDYKYAYGDSVFSRLNAEAVNMANMSPVDQVQMHYALGKAFDDVGELDTSFRHYATGGVKKRKIDAYTEQASARMFHIMKAVVNKEAFAKTEQRGCEDETPVFILGMPRSGTSLMEQILSSHPDIYGAGELKYMTSALENIDVAGRRMRFGDVEAAFPYDDNASYAARGQWFADMLKSLPPKPTKRIVDKMPGNFNFVGLIHAILPKARIIHSRRHPVETCLSCYRILFAEGHQWTYELGQLGRYYRRYWELMEHWRTDFPGVMYEVRYEDNVADVEGQAKKLIEYLGLDWNPSVLNFYNTDRPVKTASASQVRKPIYTTSTNRWRKYEKYLGPLLEEIGDIVEAYEKEIAHLSAPKEAVPA